MEFLTTKEAAEELGIAETTARLYCQEGRFGQKIGRQWLITRQEIEEFKQQRRPPGRPPKDGR